MAVLEQHVLKSSVCWELAVERGVCGLRGWGRAGGSPQDAGGVFGGLRGAGATGSSSTLV